MKMFYGQDREGDEPEHSDEDDQPFDGLRFQESLYRQSQEDAQKTATVFFVVVGLVVLAALGVFVRSKLISTSTPSKVLFLAPPHGANRTLQEEIDKESFVLRSRLEAETQARGSFQESGDLVTQYTLLQCKKLVLYGRAKRKDLARVASAAMKKWIQERCEFRLPWEGASASYSYECVARALSQVLPKELTDSYLSVFNETATSSARVLHSTQKVADVFEAWCFRLVSAASSLGPPSSPSPLDEKIEL